MGQDAESRVLIVSPNHDMIEPSTGTGFRLQQLARALSATNEVLALTPAEHAHEPPAWLSAVYTFPQGDHHYLTDLNPAFHRAMRTVLSERAVDVVHVAQPKGVCAARFWSRAVGTDPLVVLGSQVLVAGTIHQNEDLPLYKRVLGPHVLPAIERAAVRCADCITTVCEADRQGYVEQYGVSPDRVEYVSSGAASLDRQDELTPADEIRDRYGLTADTVAVFHGIHSHPPNATAVEHIAERIAPAVAERGADVEFLLVGKEMPEVDAPNVHTAGFVEDLFSVLNAADLAVVPITHGGGTKTKIFDYMTVGLPLVTTEKGAQGIDVAPDEHARVVPDAGESFVDAVCDLAASPDRRQALGDALQRLGDTVYTWEQSAQTLEDFYARVGGWTHDDESTVETGGDGDDAGPVADGNADPGESGTATDAVHAGPETPAASATATAECEVPIDLPAEPAERAVETSTGDFDLDGTASTSR